MLCKDCRNSSVGFYCRRCAYQGVRNVRFWKICHALFSWTTCFEIRPFGLLPTSCVTFLLKLWKSMKVCLDIFMFFFNSHPLSLNKIFSESPLWVNPENVVDELINQKLWNLFKDIFSFHVSIYFLILLVLRMFFK